MPALGHPTILRTIKLAPRTARVAAETDVLVVGGGPAGLGAAIGAADAGASVILTERYGFLGGNATAALVVTFASYYTQALSDPPKNKNILFPDESGGEPVIAGVLGKFVERLVKSGGALPPSPDTGFVVPFDPEVFKLVALDMLDSAGVRFLFHAFASDVASDGREKGVVFETKSGPVVIKARVIVDCTGDGDIAARAGASYEVGQPEDGLVQPMTLMFLMSGFQHTAFEEYVKKHPEEWSGVQGLRSLVRKATAEGKLDLPRDDILLFGTTREQDINVNSTRINRVLGTDVWDLTHAEWVGRRQMAQIAAFLRSYVPGFSQAYISQSGTNVCVRETRRILGEYKLTAEDILEARKFRDVIARGTYPLDIHSPLGKSTIIKKLPPGEAYDIPLRSLLPLNVDNIVVAGRCISGTHEAQSSYRVMPICMATGQAAGVCAAIAAKNGKSPRDITFADVQDELVRQGADLRSIRQSQSNY